MKLIVKIELTIGICFGALMLPLKVALLLKRKGSFIISIEIEIYLRFAKIDIGPAFLCYIFLLSLKQLNRQV